MKLYTKEMFLEASKECEVSMIDAEHIMKHIDEYVTPIELPSIEEIEKGMQKRLFVSPNPEHKMFNSGTKAGFINGAKWVLEQIKQQAK